MPELFELVFPSLKSHKLVFPSLQSHDSANFGVLGGRVQYCTFRSREYDSGNFGVFGGRVQYF